MTERFSGLTDREMEVVRAICRGLTNKEIGWELRINEQTVKNHITSILRKTGAVDRCQVAYWFAQWECANKEQAA